MIKLQDVKDIDDFIIRNQKAFLKAAEEEFGKQDQPVISKDAILESIEDQYAKTYNIVYNNTIIGGIVVNIHNRVGSLDLFFIDEPYRGQKFGQQVWQYVEKYFDVDVWQLHTPYFEKRNIHFYVNVLGFHIVEFLNPYQNGFKNADTPGGDYFFKFQKVMKKCV